MKGHPENYDWATFYELACERERKQNIVLAGKIADAERRQTDLEENLQRIYASPFWKLTAPFRKVYHAVRGGHRGCGAAESAETQGRGGHRGHGAAAGAEAQGTPETQPFLLHYREELRRQTHPYAEWIRRENNNCYDKETAVSGWQAIRIPDTDLLLLTYGKGILDKKAFSEIKSCFNNNSACLIAYADEDFYWGDLSCRMQPWFKPCYSPDTLLAFPYWGHLVAVREELAAAVLPGGRVPEGVAAKAAPLNGPAPEGAMPEGAGSGGAAPERAEDAQTVFFYDICLRLEEEARRRCLLDDASLRASVCRIESVLYHQAYEPDGETLRRVRECGDRQEQADLVEQALIAELNRGTYLTGVSEKCAPVRRNALNRRGVKADFAIGQEPDIYHILYDTSISGSERCLRAMSEERRIPPHHAVSVVIPSRDHPEALERCLRSFAEKTDYTFYEWIVVDNGSSDDNRARMEELSRRFGFTYLYRKMKFNFSRMCNLGAEQATGDLILFLNDDVEIIERSWLRRMAGQAIQPLTGAVGAKLWYADSFAIQHAGITSMEIGPSHKLVSCPDDRDYYYGRNRVVYDVIGVTGACLMVGRGKFREVGGFDETMPVAYNDVDLCFRLAEAGYYNVQRNDAVLYHYESLSRGQDVEDEGKWERLLREKEALYARHPQFRGYDPYYHPSLAGDTVEYRCGGRLPCDDPLRTVSPERAEMTAAGRAGNRRANNGRLRLTVDAAGIQQKRNLDEPEIVRIEGWSYLSGADNALYERRILLRRVGEAGQNGERRDDGAEGHSGQTGRSGNRRDSDGADYCVTPWERHREDVEQILPDERHVGLAGFVCRIRREELPEGVYRIGMLCTGADDETYLAWSPQEYTL